MKQDELTQEVERLKARVKSNIKPEIAQNIASMSSDEIVKLLLEFETYQQELERQSSQLYSIDQELKNIHREYAELYDCSPVGYLSVDQDGKITSCNQTFSTMLGIPKANLNTRLFSKYIAGRSQGTYFVNRKKLLQSLGENNCELCLVTSEKKELWVRLDCNCLLGTSGQCEEMHIVVSDITERIQADDELRTLSLALDCSSLGVFITNLEGEIEYVNTKLCEITGYSKEEIIGQTPKLFGSGETLPSVYQDLWETISTGKEWDGELYNQKKDGSYYWGRNSISSVRNAQGNITNYISNLNDVTNEYEMLEQLNYQASHDSLTGLINRMEFERRLHRLLSHPIIADQEHALFYMDLDQFKIINDTCGHTAGDELLRQVSQVLQKAMRTRDTLARLGGDEFGCLIEHCSLSQALRVGDSILKYIEDYEFCWQDKYFHIGISIGLVAITDSSENVSNLLRMADASCYAAKYLGQKRVHVYHHDDVDIARRHGEMQWVSRIGQALEEKRFCLYAQPISPLGDGRCELRYELLLRMKDEQGNIVEPGAFLPASERYGLAEKIDQWVVGTALNLLSVNPEFVKRINSLSINISGISIISKDFLGFVISRIKTNNIDTSKLCFEITETAVISNMALASDFISKLRMLGCSFALDDFGSGSASFLYLKNFPVEYLKIDGMFVKDAVDDPLDCAMVRSINEIAHIMNIKTIAEFIENEDTASLLTDIGVDYGQGYSLGVPKPFEEILVQPLLV